MGERRESFEKKISFLVKFREEKNSIYSYRVPGKLSPDRVGQSNCSTCLKSEVTKSWSLYSIPSSQFALDSDMFYFIF